MADQFEKAAKERRLQRGIPKSKSVTIKVPVRDLATARRLAERKGLPYQTYESDWRDDASQRIESRRVSLAAWQNRPIAPGALPPPHLDVNSDGLQDIVVHVATEAMQLTTGDAEAVLDAKTFSGMTIRGVDSVRVVPYTPVRETASR